MISTYFCRFKLRFGSSSSFLRFTTASAAAALLDVGVALSNTVLLETVLLKAVLLEAVLLDMEKDAIIYAGREGHAEQL
jgi:hypothetical protein